MLPVHYFNANGERLIDCHKIDYEDEQYFKQHNIKVSLEELGGDIIAYGCHYEDKTEESEVIVFANGRSCEEVMHELVERCRGKQ